MKDLTLQECFLRFSKYFYLDLEEFSSFCVENGHTPMEVSFFMDELNAGGKLKRIFQAKDSEGFHVGRFCNDWHDFPESVRDTCIVHLHYRILKRIVAAVQVSCDSSENLEQARQASLEDVLIASSLTTESVCFPGGVELRKTHNYKFSDYFSKIELVEGSDWFNLVFHVLPEYPDSHWKMLIVNHMQKLKALGCTALRIQTASELL